MLTHGFGSLFAPAFDNEKGYGTRWEAALQFNIALGHRIAKTPPEGYEPPVEDEPPPRVPAGSGSCDRASHSLFIASEAFSMLCIASEAFSILVLNL